MHHSLLTLTFLLSSLILTAQDITGTFPSLAGEALILEGYRGTKNYVIQRAKANEKGTFTFTYNAKHYGVATLRTSNNNQSTLLLLTGETIVLKGVNLSEQQSIQVEQGKENQLFKQYNHEQSLRDQAVEAWAFLDDLYYKESFLANNQQALSPAQQLIIDELERLRLQEQQFIAQLPKDSYLSWFLNTKKLITNVEMVMKFRPKYAPNYVQVFRQLNYADPKLYSSGLFASAIGNHLWLIQNAFKEEAKVDVELKSSIDQIYASVEGNDILINEVTDFIFTLFEQQGLNHLSEYVALKALNDKECALNDDTSRKLERYRKMKVGNTVEDITFGPFCSFPNHKEVEQLSEIDSPYTLIVFAAGWCPHCVTEIPKIANKYAFLKSKGIEVVLVSLDDTKEGYERFTKALPFISTTDLQKWDGEAVTNYYVNGTPMYYLVNKDLELVLNPRNLEHVETWVNRNSR